MGLLANSAFRHARGVIAIGVLAGVFAAWPTLAQSRDAAALPPVPAKLPPTFAVAAFTNNSEANAYDWLVAGAPFELAEKTEAILQLSPGYGTLVVGPEVVQETAASVATFAKTRGAVFVVTGYAERPNWELRVGATLWHITAQGPKVVEQTSEQGPPESYHQLLGTVSHHLWQQAAARGLISPLPADAASRFTAPWARDFYAVTLLGRGVGRLSGALAPAPRKPTGKQASGNPAAGASPSNAQLAAAAQDLEKAILIAPDMAQAQRMLGEVYLRQAAQATDLATANALRSKAVGRFAQATELAPDYIAAIRAAAGFALAAEKFVQAKAMYRRLAFAEPWNLDARFGLGSAALGNGELELADEQLRIVIAAEPNHVAARRAIANIANAKGNRAEYIAQLETLTTQLPNALDVRSDLASAYVAGQQWQAARGELEFIVAAAPAIATRYRLAEVLLKLGLSNEAIAEYQRAEQANPTGLGAAAGGAKGGSVALHLRARALFFARRFADAEQAYQALGKRYDWQVTKQGAGIVEHALAAIALANGDAAGAVPHAELAVRRAPALLVAHHTLIVAALRAGSLAQAQLALDAAQRRFPTDAMLKYLHAVIASATDQSRAREALAEVLAEDNTFGPARRALLALNNGAGALAAEYEAAPSAYWGDSTAQSQQLAAYLDVERRLTTARRSHQDVVMALLAELSRGPRAVERKARGRGNGCPVARVASLWHQGQITLANYVALGKTADTLHAYLARHADAGLTQSLASELQRAVTAALGRHAVRLREYAELRAQWQRGVMAELRFVRCTDQMLQIAVDDPTAYPREAPLQAAPIPPQAPLPPPPSVVFAVDNRNCATAVAVWVDGVLVGQVKGKSQGAFSTGRGQHTMCMLQTSSGQCGERGTVQQLYVHDGATITMRCPW